MEFFLRAIGGRVLLLMINFFGTRVRLSSVSNVINPDESFDRPGLLMRYFIGLGNSEYNFAESREILARSPYYSDILFREHFG